MKVKCEVCNKKVSHRTSTCIILDGLRRWVCKNCIAKKTLYIDTKNNEEFISKIYNDFEDRQYELDLMERQERDDRA